MRTMAQRGRPLVTLLATLLLLSVACTSAPAPLVSPGPSPAPTAPPSPSAGPSATPGAELSPAQLRYALLDQFSPISWCDPDFYPIARQDEQASADQHWPEIAADVPTYSAITHRLGITADDPAAIHPAERLAVYRAWKLLNAVHLEPLDSGFSFDLISETNVGLGRGIRSAGTIDEQGVIDVAIRQDSPLTACPICLTLSTLIDTPDGPVAVQNLRAGDLVWTLDGTGQRAAQPLLRVGSMPVQPTHEVMHLVLDDGRQAWVSAGHPTSDGRAVGALAPGDKLDGAIVIGIERVAYAGGATFDILPDGPTGKYWANGILLGSTLH